MKPSTATPVPPLKGWLWLAVIVVLGGFALRSIDVMRMPLFSDEGFHILRGHAIAQGELFAGLEHDKWLYTAVLALFQPLGPEGPWIARLVSALAAAISLAACIALTHQLTHLRQAALLAGLLYAVVPMAVFVERQALVEATLTAFTTCLLLIAVRLARSPEIRWFALAALCSAGAYFTKGSGLPFLLIPLLAAALFSRTWQQRLAAGAYAAGTAIIGWGAKELLHQAAARAGFTGVLETHDMAQIIPETLDRLGRPGRLADHLMAYADIHLAYLGWLVIGLIALGCLAAFGGRHLRAVLYLAAPGIAFGLAVALAEVPNFSGMVEIRYLLPTVPALCALAALGIWAAASLSPGYARAYLLIGITAAAALPLARHSIQIIDAPLTARLAEQDRASYTAAAPEGRRLLSEALLTHLPPDQPARVLAPFDCCQPYVGPRSAAFYAHLRDDRGLPALLQTWAGQGEAIFIVEDTALFSLPPGSYGVSIEQIASAQMPLGQLNLYRVTSASAQDEAARATFAWSVPPPGTLPADETALIRAAARPDIQQTLIFPENYLATVQQAQPDAQALSLDQWPADVQNASQALPLPLSTDRLVQAILVNEAHSDPQRAWLTALQQRYYFVEENWFGLFHQIIYVDASLDERAAGTSVAFGDAIRLESAHIHEVNLADQAYLLVDLAWRAAADVTTDYSLFVHVVDEAGNITAQYDAVPNRGLNPTSSWRSGDELQERFAVRLPDDAPYEVRLGLYDPVTSARLAAPQGDYVLLSK